MNTGTKMIRESDQTVFTVIFLSHWSEILSDFGEKDTVKWAFDNQYVGHSGHMYTICKE